MNMTQDVSLNERIKKYFVDEAGDGLLFDQMGRSLVNSKQSPRYFMLGFVESDNEVEFAHAFASLRNSLISDPYFSSIPSLDPKRRKTALFFHAKDDHADIRLKVFELIREFNFKFSAVIKDMLAVENYVKQRNQTDISYRYQPNELYDFTARMLLRKRLHKSNVKEIIFSKRGTSDRSAALKKQLEQIRSEIGTDTSIQSISVRIENSRNSACLQVVDYCLWALQRAYERGECRFLHAIWDKVSLIHDVDHGSAAYGLYLTRKSQPPNEEELRARWI